MHFATPAAADACGASEHFGNHGFEFHALGQVMAAPAMRCDDVIILAQGRADPHRAGLLAQIGMDVTRKDVPGKSLVQLIFALPNPVHAGIKLAPARSLDFVRSLLNEGIHPRIFHGL